MKAVIKEEAMAKRVAHWIIEDRPERQYIECSHCGSMYHFEKGSSAYYMAHAKYCPCCGYIMSEPRETRCEQAVYSHGELLGLHLPADPWRLPEQADNE